MKIVCDSCQAKYSISDDKVQGKVFKIRCKKCSNIIVVRGGAGAAEQPAPAAAPEKDTRVYDYGHDGADQAPADDDAVWHVVINQDQVGPMTAADVQQKFAAGEIDAETYAWREGFADWLPLAQVDAFAAYVASGAMAGTGGAAAVSAMFGGGDEAGTVRSDPGDLFATASSGSASSSDDDGDLFGSKPSSAAAAASAREAANAKLRGERNENSVLFSLNNLAQLASDKPASSAASPSSMSAPSAGHATGSAGGEGSGLIDIRSMANAYLGGSGGGGSALKPASASSIGSMDDLPVFGGGGFSEPAVIVPTAQRGNNNKMMFILIGSVGFLAVAAVIMVIVLLKGGDKGSGTQVAMNDKPDTEKVDDKAAPASDDKGTAPDPAGNPKPTDPAAATGDTKVADDTSAKPAVVPTEPRKSDTKRDSKPSSSSRDTKPAATATARTDPKPTTTAAAPKAEAGGCDEVSCVLNNYEGACCAKFKKGGGAKAGGSTPAKGGSDLPDSLDRVMISDGVNKVKARVMACGTKSSAKGQVKVSVKVNANGSVGSVSVKTTPDEALGSCVAAAMQKASFSKTANGGSFGYPFVF